MDMRNSRTDIDWCKNTAGFDRSVIFVMIMPHAVTKQFFDIEPLNISHIKVTRRILCFTSTVSSERKKFKRAHQTKRNGPFPIFSRIHQPRDRKQ